MSKDDIKKLVDDITASFSYEDKNKILFSEVKDYISTQSPVLDYTLGTKGIPCGRWTDLEGLESTGKSLLILHLIAETQKRGGIAVLVDSEQKFNIPFAKSIGVDTDSLIPLQPDTLEEAFEAIESTIDKIREKKPDILTLIAIDSLSALPPEAELEAGYKDYSMGLAARKISQALRKLVKKIAKDRIAMVTVSHLKYKMSGMAWGDKYTAAGGLAPKFASSLRLRLVKTSNIKDDNKKVIGIQAQITTVKNHLSSPYKTCELFIYFNKGIDKERSYVDCAMELGIIKKVGAWFVIGEGEQESKFHMKDFPEIDKKFKIIDKVNKEIYK